jgi:4-hydroxy-tetrahydrodipicolinate reductase
MKVALIGYGKMGKAIEELLIQRHHDVVARFRSHTPIDRDILKGCDVAIEFTQPTAAVANLTTCLECGVPVVTGTTGWHNQLEEVTESAERLQGSLFHATNFSLGVYLFNEIIRAAARMLSPHQEYTPSMREIHHIHKKDAPSGTALTLASHLFEAYPKLKAYSTEAGDEGVLLIDAIREGEVNGYHEVRFSSGVDEITLSHEAFNRSGFALGAVKAAEWLPGNTGVFTIADLIKHLAS